jgi:hypothetical protein
MPAHRIVFIILALLLVGCESDQEKIKTLEAEKLQLQIQVHRLQRISQEAQEKVDVDYARQMAAFDQAEHLAGIARGCRALVNVCPESVTAPGDAAIAAGHSGAGTSVWWLIWWAKWLFFILILGLAAALWTLRLRPDLNAQRVADKKLNKTHADLHQAKLLEAAAKHRQEEIERGLASKERAIEQAEIRLQGYEYEIGQTKVELDELEQEKIQKQSTVDMLGVFKKL